MYWWQTPPESPNLNPIKNLPRFCCPIENLWHELKKYIRHEIKPRTKDELVEGIKLFWRTVDQKKCFKYIHVIPKKKHFNYLEEIPAEALKFWLPTRAGQLCWYHYHDIFTEYYRYSETITIFSVTPTLHGMFHERIILQNFIKKQIMICNSIVYTVVILSSLQKILACWHCQVVGRIVFH